MRINRLDLTRYGKFTDYSLDFGEHTAAEHDLHLVYGPNEAGKSTLLAAFMDLLYGIETRSQYGFLHPYATMRIAADIDVDGSARQFVRIKRPRNSLLDAADKPIADSAILSDLGGIDRHAFTTMFSLDDDTLEKGGETILASKGDLGQLLFAASAGLAELSQTLGHLDEEADSFYKLRARSGKLADLTTRLKELTTERDAIDTAAADHAHLVDERDRATLRYEETITERGRVRSRLDVLRRQRAALPRQIALRDLRDRIAPLADIPEAPLGFLAALPTVQRADVELSAAMREIEAELRKTAEELDGIVVKDTVLDLADRIDGLTDLRSRAVAASTDLPECQMQHRQTVDAIAALLARMDCSPDTEPADLLLGASTTGALRELLERRSLIDAGLTAAAEEHESARRHAEEAWEALKAVGGEGPAIPTNQLVEIRAALTVARADDHAARRRLAAREHAGHLATLEDRLRDLRPWAGDANALRDLTVPAPEETETWKNAKVEAERRIDRLDADIQRLSTEQRALTAELDAARQMSGVVNDEQAAEVRAAREDAWTWHKRSLDADSAEAFEANLRRDDILTGNRIGAAAEVARLGQVTRDLARVSVDLDTERSVRVSSVESLEAVQGELTARIRQVSSALPPDWTVTRLESWVATREKALDSLLAVETADRERRDAEQDGAGVRHKLIDVASVAGIRVADDASVEALVSTLQLAIERDTEHKALRSDADARDRHRAERERALETAIAVEQQWNARWTERCAGCWLGQDGSIPTVTTVREVLNALEGMGPLIDKQTALTDRIQAMENDRARFEAEVVALADSLELEKGSAPLDTASAITRAFEAATMAQAARASARMRLKDAESRHAKTLQSREANDRRKFDMMAHFHVESLIEVDNHLRNLEKRNELDAQVTATEQEIRLALDAPSIEAAEETLDAMDRSAVDAEIAELESRFEDLDTRSRELFTEHSKAADRLEAVGGDDAVVRIEAQRRTTLLEIEEGAQRYLRLRLGIKAAEQALRVYRDQHRSSMMARASDAFRTMSRDAYQGLATQPDKDSEVLIAVSANGGSKIASELSKGTRFQLYLALRVAGYLEFVQSRPPVPFIADDIMETFDDFRAEETFRLFADMASAGQVIYLTHHRHLCDIARTVCPSVRVHELAESLVQGQ